MINKRLVQEELIRRRCKKDVKYYVNNFVKTLSYSDKYPRGMVVPFKLWEYQEVVIDKMLDSYLNSKDLLMDKSRDMGATWLEIAFDSWGFLFEDNFSVLLGSKKERDVDGGYRSYETIFGKLDLIFDNLPVFLLPVGFEGRKHRTYLKYVNPVNGNRLVGDSSDGEFSRSGRYSKVFMDEFAFWDQGDKVLSATADSTRHRMFISTANGMGNSFANLRFGGGVEHLELHWRKHPTKGKGSWFDPLQNKWRSPWYDKEVKRRLNDDPMSYQMIAQELDINYIQSGSPVFNDQFLKLTPVWETHPMPNDVYAIGCDTSQGLEGGDFSSFDILCKRTGEQVFSWKGKVSNTDLAWMLIEYGTKYNMAKIAVENNFGNAVIEVLKKNYSNLYKERSYSKSVTVGTGKVGWNTNRSTKSLMILQLQSALILGKIKLTNRDTLDELRIYAITETGGDNFKYGAPSGKHDDKVISLAIAWQVLQSLKMPLTEEQKRQKARKRAKNKRSIINPSTGY